MAEGLVEGAAVGEAAVQEAVQAGTSRGAWRWRGGGGCFRSDSSVSRGGSGRARRTLNCFRKL